MLRKLSKRTALSNIEREALLSLPSRSAAFDRGAYMVREGDKVETCYALVNGFAYRQKMAGSGARQILSIHLRGDMVDLQNSLLDVADHSVQALTRVEAVSIPRKAVIDLAAEHPNIARALWRDTLIDGSIFREWMLNIGQRDAHQRIAHLFCELAVRQEAADMCEGPNFAWPMTQEQIGDATGLTSVHVNRTVQRMRGEGLINTANQTVTIEDWPALQAAADFSRAYLHLPEARAEGR
ncbi:hypothetical protein L288_09390 [Sphingobium quisquiliarum P25]|uniref:HTH crp-type domain-containing protein n=2 Tax=Sphingobium quisquiliarum TaxID=538379 RepID=T0H6V8_9SPHN|nr:hypothetical protein L288_09390 [Sphingobium quisquiliarum P25]